MKLKLIVATMSVLGLVHADVFAAHNKYHAVSDTAAAKHDYKDMGALMPAAEVCPKVDMYDSMLDLMSQNVGRAKPTMHCADPLSLAGGLAFVSTWGSRHMGYSGENSDRLGLNDGYLNAYGNVNEWVQAFASLSFTNYNPQPSALTVNPNQTGSYVLRGTYTNSYNSNQINLEQGFITVKNMDVIPVFLRIGKMFTDFDRYTIHAATESFTQVMSESLHTTAQIGFMTRMGLNGSVYTFENPMRQLVPGGSYDGHNKNNYGLSLNFNQPSDQLGYDLGLGYIYDFTGIDQITYGVTRFNGTGTNNSGLNGTYQNRVSGGTLYADLNSGPFSVMVHYVTALQAFNAADLPTKTAIVLAGTPGTGAKPWAADITAGYGFNVWGKDQNVYLGYQGTGNAVNLFLPRSRWLAGYGITVWKSTTLGIQWNHDQSYSTTYTTTGNGTSNLVTLRAGVQFG